MCDVREAVLDKPRLTHEGSRRRMTVDVRLVNSRQPKNLSGKGVCIGVARGEV